MSSKQSIWGPPLAAAFAGFAAAASLAGADGSLRAGFGMLVATGGLAVGTVARPFTYQVIALFGAGGATAGLQTRFGHDLAKEIVMYVAVALVACACGTGGCRLVWRSRIDDGSWRMKVGCTLIAAATALRFGLVTALALPSGYRWDRIKTGFLPLPVAGGIQVGEFTRIALVVGAALVAGVLAAGGRSGLGNPLPKAATLLFAVYVVCGMALDTGPTAITLLACGVATWTAVRARQPADSEPPGRRRTRSPQPVALTLTAAVVAAVGIGAVTSSSTVSARLADWRAADLSTATLQTQMARIAAAEGGLIGRGWGTGAFGSGIYAADSDYALASIAADLGLLPALGLVALVLVALAQLGAAGRVRMRAQTEAVTRALAALSITWLLVAALGGLGILPLTGISAPFLVLKGSSIISSGLLVGVIVGFVQGDTGPATVRHQAWRAPVWARTVAAGLVVYGIVMACLTPSRGALATYRPIGDLLARDGSVVATTGPDESRTYPTQSLYADLGGSIWVQSDSGRRLWSRYGLETSPLLTCGNEPDLSDWLATAIHPVPCLPVDLVSTISPIAQTAISRAIATSDLRPGQVSAAYVDATNGEILGLYSGGVADPNSLEIDPAAPPPAPWPAIDSWRLATPPGSAFKPLIMAAAVDLGVPTPSRALDRLVTDPETGEGMVNASGARCPDGSVGTALAASCNTVAADYAIAAGAGRLADYVNTHFGADSELSYDVADVSARPRLTTGLGSLATADGNTSPALARTSIGQESVTASPLSLAAAYVSLVRGTEHPGEPVPLAHLAAGVCQEGKYRAVSWEQFGASPSADASAQVLSGMRSAITAPFGTARSLVLGHPELSGRDLAAKTGTAEVATDATGTATRVDRWAVAVLDSRYVLVVRVLDTADNTGNPALALAGNILADTAAIGESVAASPECPANSHSPG
ncbi:MAG: FtsW/RodA/SpoVE family cell cycle protein [Bifidobacteriaceae bacterium]|jgi:cell division protein FtsW (lipid II flippase)|nr:FtsW/RodA/SpoVE family cell cycle protein [Bifidobacteriaceae bacterium]